MMLAAMPYNENAGRPQATTKDGSLRHSIFYPKFKNGQHVVKTISIPMIFGKWSKTMTSMFYNLEYMLLL